MPATLLPSGSSLCFSTIEGKSNPEGRGYVDLARIIGFFADTFDNVQDVTTTLNRLVASQLIEANTRSLTSVLGASHVRVTAAGWYYARHLAHKFAYLDLVLQDTPLDDSQLERTLRQSVYEVNNLGDRETDKEERMRVRFNRTQIFIDYLKAQEREEFKRFDMGRLPQPFCTSVVEVMQKRFFDERAYIERRLKEGRLEDAPDEPDDRVAQQFELPSLEPEENP